MNKITKNILTLSTVMFVMGSLTSCGSTGDNITYEETNVSNKTDTENSSISEISEETVTSEEMPEPFSTGTEIGGDENADFYQPCNRVLDNIPAELMALRDETEVNEWINSFDSIKNAPSNILEYANMFSFITHFDISKEEAQDALSAYLNSDDEQIKITEDELNTIFSGNMVEITKMFASEYSIVIDENVYCPCWVYIHTEKDYENAGITPEMISEKATLYMTFNLTNEASQAFSEKLSEYTGETVNIEPKQNNESSNIDDIIEDESEYADNNDIVEDEVADEMS